MLKFVRENPLAYVGGIFFIVGVSFWLAVCLFIFDIHRFLTRFGGTDTGDQWLVLSIFVFLGSLCIGISLWLMLKFGNQIKLEQKLAKEGKRVLADFVRVKKGTITINNQTSQRIVAEWINPDDNKKYIFESRDVWLEVLPFTVGSKVPVLVDPSNPKRYFVQLGK